MSTDPAPDGDPFGRLLDPSLRGRSLRAPHWAGIGGLAGAIVVAAVVIPPLITPTMDPNSSSPGATGSAPASTPFPASTPAPAPTPGASASPRPTLQRDATTTPTTRRPQTPSPTASPTGGQRFTPVSVQAEAPGNRLADGAGVTSCDTCDGGARVRYIGELTVYATLPAAGTRTITVTYECDGRRHIEVSTANSEFRLFTLTGTSWQTPATFTFEANLPAGRVALDFRSNGSSAPDIDKITIS
ncbi:hypothetical protein GCM10022251_75670 [Phytohabitans flavus]|uniref:CBM6 domain-containing protein n=1 Tax=Phytohabitans flavus TaxID=1076124 RepID=A0A6F8XMF5_9ACTN|nr:hypothetical protein [Phytohabitans flavus]BCB75002.1 hypothetical protein Pflav_014120 [Phytohabitans flavus]